MTYQRNTIYLLSVFFAISSSACAKTESLQMNVNPIAYLSAGATPDNTLLARIHISGIDKGCNLRVWDELAVNEFIPGHYVLIDKENGEISLSVKLTGDNWQPDTNSGRGAFLRNPDQITEVELRTNGEQNVKASLVPVHITAHCFFNNPTHEDTVMQKNR